MLLNCALILDTDESFLLFYTSGPASSTAQTPEDVLMVQTLKTLLLMAKAQDLDPKLIPFNYLAAVKSSKDLAVSLRYDPPSPNNKDILINLNGGPEVEERHGDGFLLMLNEPLRDDNLILTGMIQNLYDYAALANHEPRVYRYDLVKISEANQVSAVFTLKQQSFCEKFPVCKN